MKVLFIGGTGIISSACSRLAVERGIELYLLTRGKSLREMAPGARSLPCDFRDPTSVREALGSLTFDSVVNWIAYTPDQVEADLNLFRGCTGQYVFISSASAYQKPARVLPVTESTPLDNPIWRYSQNKIACEERLVRARREERFPFTIVRPSHTYDPNYVPLEGGWTVIDRMLRGKPVIVHGDGSSLWTLTHNVDFAKGFVPLLGNPRAIGDAFHITSDEWLTWNQIYELLAHAAGVKPQLVHVPSDLISAYDAELGYTLLGDKTHNGIFDNSKIKHLVPEFCATIPFARGAEQIIAAHRGNPALQVVKPAFNDLCDRILSAYLGAFPKA
jgi:nucleoside-diphosphate-sugar epimerase